MFLELKRPIVFFDLETTGVDVDNDKIVEIAMVKVLPGKPPGKDLNESGGTYVQRFHPEIRIPKEATEVHGITDEDVADSPLFEGKAKEIFRFLDGCDLAGFNVISFDIPLLQNELIRCGLCLDLQSITVVDAKQIFFMKEPRNLEAAVRKYVGREHENAHNALADVVATMEVVAGQQHEYSDLPDTPDGIYEMTRDPDQVDFGGKIVWKGDDMVFTFGKEKGKPFRHVPHGYFRWVKSNNVVGPDAVEYVIAALNGRFLTRKEWTDVRAHLRSGG